LCKDCSQETNPAWTSHKANIQAGRALGFLLTFNELAGQEKENEED
jgi:hypothetical protein